MISFIVAYFHIVGLGLGHCVALTGRQAGGRQAKEDAKDGAWRSFDHVT
jgi:hypothetical protein